MSLSRRVGFGAQVLAVVGLVYIAGQGTPASPQAQGRSEEAMPEHVPNEVLVQYRAGANEGAKSRARGRVNATADDALGRLRRTIESD